MLRGRLVHALRRWLLDFLRNWLLYGPPGWRGICSSHGCQQRIVGSVIVIHIAQGAHGQRKRRVCGTFDTEEGG